MLASFLEREFLYIRYKFLIFDIKSLSLKLIETIIGQIIYIVKTKFMKSNFRFYDSAIN